MAISGQPQVIRVKTPLILRSPPVVIGILSARPFGEIDDRRPIVPAYEVPKPLILRGPPPKPANPPRSVLEGSCQWQDRLLAALDAKQWLLRAPAPPAPTPSRRITFGGMDTFVGERWTAFVTHGAYPASAPSVGAPRPRINVVNEAPEDPIQAVVPKPVWMSQVLPTSIYIPPMQKAWAWDDNFLATLFEKPQVIGRGVVPTPAPVGAPRPFMRVVTPWEVAPLLVIEPIIIHIVPVGHPDKPCPPPAPRIEVDCTFRGIADQVATVYARMDEGCEQRGQVDECCAGESANVVITPIVPVPPIVTAPTVTSITPGATFLQGNTFVVITGTGFVSSSTSVKFGSVAAQWFLVVSDTTINAFMFPTDTAGAVDVSVTTPNGTGTLTDGFTFSQATLLDTPEAFAASGVGSGFSSNGCWGPDSRIWMPLFQVPYGLYAVTSSGVGTIYPSGDLLPTSSCCVGPDGNIWATSILGHIYKVTTAGVFTKYDLADQADGYSILGGICVASDGQIAVVGYSLTTSDPSVWKVALDGTSVRHAMSSSFSFGYAICEGPTGDLFITPIDDAFTDGYMVKINNSGMEISRQVTPGFSGFLGIAATKNRVLVYVSNTTDYTTAALQIFDPADLSTYTQSSSIADISGYSCNIGSDGNVWLTGLNAAGTHPQVVKMTTGGTVLHTYTLTDYSSAAACVVVGDDGSIYVALTDSLGSIVKIPAG